MRTRTPTLYLDFRLKPGCSHTQEVEEGWTAFIYILEGWVRVGQVDKKLFKHALMLHDMTLLVPFPAIF